jgi:hypothetical protein
VVSREELDDTECENTRRGEAGTYLSLTSVASVTHPSVSVTPPSPSPPSPCAALNRAAARVFATCVCVCVSVCVYACI